MWSNDQDTFSPKPKSTVQLNNVCESFNKYIINAIKRPISPCWNDKRIVDEKISRKERGHMQI